MLRFRSPGTLASAAALSLVLGSAATPTGAQVTFQRVVDGSTPIPGHGSGELFDPTEGDQCDGDLPRVAAAVDQGRVVFWAGSQDPTSPYRGIFSWQSGVLNTVAEIGATPPGSSSPFSVLNPSPTTLGGAIGFGGSADAPAVYHSSGGVVTEVARVGDPAPGGSTFDNLAVSRSPAAEPGGLAFYGETADGRDGIFYWNGSSLALVADTATEPPDHPGLTFEEFPRVGVSLVGGRVVFLAETDIGTAPTVDQRQGIYLWDDGVLTTLVAETVSGDTSFEDLGDSPGLAPSFDGERVVFYAEVQLTAPPPIPTVSAAGLYEWRDGAVEPLVLTGLPRPDGGIFEFASDFDQFAVFGERVVFSYDSCEVLYVLGPGGPSDIVRLVGRGDLVDGRPVEYVSVGRMGIDAGGVAFNVSFGDSAEESDAVYYAAFPVTVVAPIPTAGTWALVGLAVILSLSGVLVLRRL